MIFIFLLHFVQGASINQISFNLNNLFKAAHRSECGKALRELGSDLPIERVRESMSREKK
jgi:hypothetical protein